MWIVAASVALLSVPAQGAGKTTHVIFVMMDGMRWQDVFRGADPDLLNKEHGGVGNVEEIKRDFWRDTPQGRREALMPFVWGEIAKKGQIYGNRDRGSDAYVTNGFNFSYPGYNEILCGFPDPRVDSNDKKPNPNVTVLEWLNRKPAYAGKVAAFAAWDTFPSILNVGRSSLVVNAGYDPLTIPPMNPRIELLNRLKIETNVLDEEPMDATTFHTAIEYVRLHQPKVLYLSLGESDEWAHAGRYDLYLRSSQRFDQFVKELWETVQSMPEYRGTTTLILGVDHGRGVAPTEWRGHGQKVPDSKNVWMAFLGPDTRALGERSKVAPITQSQIAATLAALLGEDYNAAVKNAGAVVRDVLSQ